MQMLPNSMSVFVSRYLAESIVDFSRELSSPGKRVSSHHTFPTSSIANASSVLSPSIACWLRKCSVSRTSFPLSFPVSLQPYPARVMTSSTLFPLSLTLPPRSPQVLLRRPRLKSFGFRSESWSNSAPRRAIIRRDWQRFLAVRITASQALPMLPVLAPHAIVVLDRHYNSLARYRPPLAQSLRSRYGQLSPFATSVLTQTASSCVRTRSTTPSNSSTWGLTNRPQTPSSAAPVSAFPNYERRERLRINF
jgi:hypothetical protein